MNNRITKITASIFMLAITNLTYAASIDFSNIGTYQTDEIIIEGVSITASDTINILKLNGLGVDSGTGYSNSLEGSEWMTFSFLNQPATDVVLNLQTWGNGGDEFKDTWFTITSYDITNSILGTYTAIDTEAFSFNINDLTSTNTLSSFTILMDEDVTRISSIAYQPVPIPTALFLFISGILGIASAGLRRTRKHNNL